MFNLEQSITEWRRQMLAAGIKSPATLEELENHLREEMEQQKRCGLNNQRAFEVAVEKIGKASVLKQEFKKIRRTSPLLHGLMISICVIFVGFIILLSSFTILVCYEDGGDRAMAFAAVSCILLVACGWKYGVPFLPVIQDTWKRMIIGWACVLSGIIVSTFFCQVILPLFGRGDNQLPAIGLWTVFLVAIFFLHRPGLDDGQARAGNPGNETELIVCWQCSP